MSSNLYGIMYTGKSALLTQQLAISVTGQNIANADTEGYSRQELRLTTNFPVSSPVGQIGTGVKAVEIQRVYDRFVAAQVNEESTSRGRWEARNSSLQQVETVFNESENYGLGQAMNEFWNAWQEVSNDSENETPRMVLVNKSESLVSAFHGVYQDVEEIRVDIDGSMATTLTSINHITEQIADLNGKIRAAENLDQNANDYRDSRDLLLTELSSMMDIQSYENEDGSLNVTTSRGRSLVLGENNRLLTAAPDLADPGMHMVIWNDSDGTAVDITSEIAGGRLKGLMEIRDDTIPEYLGRLDDLANNLVAEVNALHSAGFGLVDNATGIPYQGNTFFDATVTGAADISLDPVVATTPKAIAASATLTGVPGDNANAIAITELQHALTMGGSESFGEYYSGLVAGIGSQAQEAETWHAYQSQVETQLKNYRESVSGVSIDEEMIDLVQFQHSYESAAKLIATIDEMMQTVLQMV